MRLPAAPLTAKLEDIHKSVCGIANFLNLVHKNGSANPGFTQDQINLMTDKSQLGKTVFNQTTNENNTSYLDAGVVKWRSF